MEIVNPRRLSWESLTGCLVLGFLLKIGVSVYCLLPPLGLALSGPRVSEAATAAPPPGEKGHSLPHLLAQLQTERQALMTREAALAAKERHLMELKQEIEERLKELEALQSRLLETLEEEKRIKGEQMRHLVATLQAMSPERASKVLEKMADEEAVRLLRRLPGKEAGAILSLLPPDKAAGLSRALLQ